MRTSIYVSPGALEIVLVRPSWANLNMWEFEFQYEVTNYHNRDKTKLVNKTNLLYRSELKFELQGYKCIGWYEDVSSM